MDAKAYAHRPRPYGHEIAYRLEPEGLFIDTGRRQEVIAYGRIQSVRLSYQPTNVGAAGFRARLRLADGRSLTIGNLTWKSWVEVKRHDGPYRSFVTELVARAATANPRLLCISGQPILLWGAVVVAGTAMAAALVVATILAARRGEWPNAVLAGLVLAGFGWQAREMVVRNRPTLFRPEALPAAVLPPG
jgi:hypothetical protein